MTARETDIATMLDEWRTVSERHRAAIVTGLACIGTVASDKRVIAEQAINEILADRERLSGDE